MKWHKYPIKSLCQKDAEYPQALLAIAQPPAVLYYRGAWSPKKIEKSLAVVGSRRLTQYGRIVIDKILSVLVPRGITIISGFMYGTDTEAHIKCLEYRGTTIAVLGSGLDVIYPPENEQLYEKVLDAGGVIFSEYEAETKPQLWTFPQRNRIVSGLAGLGVLVVEADEKSGSLITASLAKKQGKKLFAVPGPITSKVSLGTNMLIKTHQAEMVLTADDILGQRVENKLLFEGVQLTSLEQKIKDCLERESLSGDELAMALQKTIVEINQALTMMSLKGVVNEAAGKFFVIA